MILKNTHTFGHEEYVVILQTSPSNYSKVFRVQDDLPSIYNCSYTGSLHTSIKTMFMKAIIAFNLTK